MVAAGAGAGFDGGGFAGALGAGLEADTGFTDGWFVKELEPGGCTCPANCHSGSTCTVRTRSATSFCDSCGACGSFAENASGGAMIL